MSYKPLFALGILCLALNTQSVNAEPVDYLSGFTSKVSQGFFNLTSAVIELPKNIINISHDQNILVGLTWGSLRGVVHTVTRTVVGGVELISAPIPSGEFIAPAYVWQRFSEDSRYFGLNLPGYWTSYGPLDDGK